MGQKGKTNTRKKNDNTIRGYKSESTGERRKIKKISIKGKIIRTKKDIPKQSKKILGGDGTKTYQKTDASKLNNFGGKYGNQEKITKKPNG